MAKDPNAKTIGRYQILEELGRGAMGIVYKGHDPVIGRTVALKTIAIQGDDGDAAELRQRLFREASAAGNLTHPNIVTVYDVVEEGGVTAVAMEFIEGETLKDTINTRAPMHIELALDLFEQIAAALDYAGAKKVVHRDIKPANIMVTFDGRAKVADFGLARIGGATVTKNAMIMGTPSYMSPEQACGLTLDGRSDLFSAAVVLYEMVTRQKVFAGKDLGDTLERIVRKPAPIASQFNPALEPEVDAVLDRALAKEADQRYQTGADLVKALRQATATQALPTMAIPDAEDPEAKTIVMLPRSALAATASAAAALKPAASARVPAAAASKSQSATRGGTVPIPPPPSRRSAGIDPDLRIEHRPEPMDRPSGSKGLIVAIIVAALVLGSVGIGIIATMRKQGASPATVSQTATSSQPPSDPKATAPIAPGNEPTPAPPTNPEPKSTATPPTPPRARGRSAQPAREGDPASAPAPATATLQLQYDGAPYPLSLVADGKTVGRVAEGQMSLTVEAGRLHLRAVNEQLFLDHDLGSVSLAPGERRTLTIPATAVAVIGVRGENYTGLRILLDGRPLSGPYPAQLPRIAASHHRIEFRWSDGALQGVAIADTIDLTGGRQFIIRAVPEGATVNVQKVR